MKINLNGYEVRVFTQRSTRARKTADIEFTARDELKIILPTAMEMDVADLVKSNMSTIQRKHKEYLTRVPVYQDGKILIHGLPRELILDENSDIDGVELVEDTLVVRTCGQLAPMKVLNRWMTGQTKAIVESIQKEHGLESPAHLRIVDTARWGYVRDKTIHINNQLITLPPKLQEFTVIHEHLHLQHMNHGTLFQAKLSENIPDYPLREQELSKYLAMTKNQLIDEH